MIEIIGADVMWEKAKLVNDEKARIEKQRIKTLKKEVLKKAIEKIQDAIKISAEQGNYIVNVHFEQCRDEKQDKWHYLPDMVNAILKLFSIAGYDIIWEPSQYIGYYGNFKIIWEK